MDNIRDVIFTNYDRAFECLECQAVFGDECPDRCDGCGNIVFLRHEKHPANCGYDPSSEPPRRRIDDDFGLRDFLRKKRAAHVTRLDAADDDDLPSAYGYPFALGGDDSLFGGTD